MKIMKPKKLNGGSDKYGACEVCGKNCNTTFILRLTEDYELKFGHEECLNDLCEDVNRRVQID